MTAVKNVSTTRPLHGTVWGTAQPQDPPAAWQQAPGETRYYGSSERSWAYYYFFDTADIPGTPQTAFWSGRIHNHDGVDVDPEKKQVTIEHSSIKEHDLARFKALFPHDSQIQNIELSELIQKSRGKAHDGRGAEMAANDPPPPSHRSVATPCEIAIAGVVIDVVYLAFGLTGLHGKVSGWRMEELVEQLKPHMSEIEKLAAALENAEGFTAIGIEVVKLLKLLSGAFMLEAVVRTIVGSLTVWDMVLYGVLSMAEIAGAFLTDGAEIAAIVAADLALAGFFVHDVHHAYEVCREA